MCVVRPTATDGLGEALDWGKCPALFSGHMLPSPLGRASPELSKGTNRDYRSVAAMCTLLEMQALVVGGIGTWTAARTVERCAA